MKPAAIRVFVMGWRSIRLALNLSRRRLVQICAEANPRSVSLADWRRLQ